MDAVKIVEQSYNLFGRKLITDDEYYSMGRLEALCRCELCGGFVSVPMDTIIKHGKIVDIPAQCFHCCRSNRLNLVGDRIKEQLELEQIG